MTRLLRPRLGVIGGLGPLASADFYRKFTELTPAASDAEHVPLVLLSLTDLPDRTLAILEGSDTVLAPLSEAIALLNDMGVEKIAMPCNTAHHWYEQLAGASRAEIVHIVDSVVDALDRAAGGGRVAVLATQGTLSSGFYHDRLLAEGYEVCAPLAPAFQAHVDEAIRLVKAGRRVEAGRALQEALGHCEEEDIGTAILACTELSCVDDRIDPGPTLIVDSNTALASACLRSLGVEARQTTTSAAGRSAA